MRVRNTERTAFGSHLYGLRREGFVIIAQDTTANVMKPRVPVCGELRWAPINTWVHTARRSSNTHMNEPLQFQPLAAYIPAPRRKRRVVGRVMVAGLSLLLCVGTFRMWSFVDDMATALPAIPANPAASARTGSVILAADGTEIGRVFSTRQEWIPLDDMSPWLVKALVATEDHRFRDHGGVDWWRLAGAAWHSAWGDPEGASTIPMQLARGAFPTIGNRPLVERKVQEMIMARRLVAHMDRNDILEWYLNTAAFGYSTFGAEAVAERFFSTNAASLDLPQSAMLVAMLKSASWYNPFRNPDRVRQRRSVVLQRMVDTGVISMSEARKAAATPLGLVPSTQDPADSPAPHYVDYVRAFVEDWAARAGYDPDTDGLVIHTGLDLEAQAMAARAANRQAAELQSVVDREWGIPSGARDRLVSVGFSERFWRSRSDQFEQQARRSSRFASMTGTPGASASSVLAQLRGDVVFADSLMLEITRLEAGLVALEPGTGIVKAWVGGLDYRRDQFDKVGMARRQPGSTFKAFVYASALKAGLSPYYMVQDRIRTFETPGRNPYWTPTNSGGGASGRNYTMRAGLIWSKNTVAAHLMSRVGPLRVMRTAEAMGVHSPLLPVPSLALGTSEVTLLEMTSAYGTLASSGAQRDPVVVTRITDRSGRVLADFWQPPSQAIPAQHAYTLLDMMRGVVDQGTGSGIRTRFGVRGDIAGKTGTTQNNADGWFLLMHPDLVTGAWVGFNDQRISFRSNYWGQGGHNALLLVGDFMRQATRNDTPTGRRLLSTAARFRPPPGYIVPRAPVYSDPEPTPTDAPPALTAPIVSVPLLPVAGQ